MTKCVLNTTIALIFIFVLIGGCSALHGPIELRSGAGITFPDTPPSTTTDTLYGDSGTLKYGGSAVSLLDVITIGNYSDCTYVTDYSSDEVQLEAAFATIDQTTERRKTIRIVSMLNCSRTPVINNTVATNGVPFIIEGVGFKSGWKVPASTAGLQIKNPAMGTLDQSCVVRDLCISGPDSAHLGTYGIDWTGAETDTNLIDVRIRYFATGVNAASPASYNCNFVRVNTAECNNGIAINGANNLLEHCVSGYDIPAGTNTGYGFRIAAVSNGNNIAYCDSGDHNKGLWLYTGFANTITSHRHDGAAGYSVYVEGSISNKFYSGHFPAGSTIYVDGSSHYNTFYNPAAYYGTPYIVIISGAVYNSFLDIEKRYDVGDSSLVTDGGSYTNFARSLTASSDPSGVLSGRVGMVVWNNAAATGDPAGWVCTTAGNWSTSIWKPMADLG